MLGSYWFEKLPVKSQLFKFNIGVLTLFLEVEKSTFTEGSPFLVNEPVSETVALSGCVKFSFCYTFFVCGFKTDNAAA